MTRPSSSATTDSALLSPGRVLAGFAISEEVTGLLDGCLADLVGTLPALRVRRGFYAGAWRLGAHREGFGAETATSDEAVAREHRPHISRIDFELRVDGERERVNMIARTTIRGHDRRPERFATAMDDAGRPALKAWIESTLLDFADRYTANRYRRERPERA
jgi:hypothetical protein